MDGRVITLRLPTAALAAITDLLADREDRSDFLREATELEIAIRSLDVYPELLGYLTANESLADFCARAVRQAAEQRISMLKGAGVGGTAQLGADQQPKLGEGGKRGNPPE